MITHQISSTTHSTTITAMNAPEKANATASFRNGLRIMAFVSGSMHPTQRVRARDLKTINLGNVL